jgi:uncharacterized DUF497 family protein
MADDVLELLVTEAAVDKLGGRSIAIHEVHQLQRNAHLTVRNPRSDPPDRRRLLIGRTNGGRALTLVVERTGDPATWLIVTGWDATTRERRMLGS